MVDVIIVNWNAGSLLKECLRSLSVLELGAVYVRRVFVVDNASTDASLDGVESLGLPLEIIRNAENRGFAAACNQAAALAKSEYLLFLNPDTEVSKGSLEEPIAFLSKEPHFAICGIQLLDSSGRIARSCARFPSAASMLCHSVGLNKVAPQFFRSYFMEDWGHDESRAVDHVMGAFFLVRRSVFMRLGGFDERFFVYLEDLDFSLRAKRAGYATYYLTEASAYHRGGGTSEQVRATRLFYSLRSRLLYAYKHLSLPSASLVLFASLILEPVLRLCLAIRRGSTSAIAETIAGYSRLWWSLPEIFQLGFSRHSGATQRDGSNTRVRRLQ